MEKSGHWVLTPIFLCITTPLIRYRIQKVLDWSYFRQELEAGSTTIIFQQDYQSKTQIEFKNQSAKREIKYFGNWLVLKPILEVGMKSVRMVI